MNSGGLLGGLSRAFAFAHNIEPTDVKHVNHSQQNSSITKGPPGSMWGIMLHSEVGVGSFRDTVVRGGPRVTFGLLTYQHLVHVVYIHLSRKNNRHANVRSRPSTGSRGTSQIKKCQKRQKLTTQSWLRKVGYAKMVMRYLQNHPPIHMYNARYILGFYNPPLYLRQPLVLCAREVSLRQGWVTPRLLSSQNDSRGHFKGKVTSRPWNS